MNVLRFYCKSDCCLCDEAWPVVERLARRHGLSLEKIDIEGDADLSAAHGDRIPVLVLGDEELGWGRLSERGIEHQLARRR